MKYGVGGMCKEPVVTLTKANPHSKHSVISAEIRIKYLYNTNQSHYCFSQFDWLLSFTG